MPTIHELPDLLVNKIAAGEVIERPASVVKELLENALDAGGSSIQLLVEDGGRKLIRVTDNGSGIPAAELPLAVRPHATSKIQCEEDLYRISSMGFRGEALASIGAAAHLVITTRTAASLAGAAIHVAGDRIESSAAAGCPVGTTIEVRDLFFNVPARRKFLRAANTELGHIQEQLARIALANPEVEFDFRSGRRTVKHLPPCNGMRERIAAFYGAELAHDLVSIERQERGLCISGFAAKPAQNRASSKWQYVFLNGRYIRDRYVQHATREAFRGLMEHARNPVVFLNMAIDPAHVDVNVHPTKIEVRWQDSNMVYSQVLSALREALLHADLTPALNAQRASSAPTDDQRRAERLRIAEFFKHVEPQVGGGAAPRSGGGASTGSPGAVSMAELALQFQSPPLADSSTAPPPAPAASALQLHKTYLVTESEDGMLVIDQHALHERIIYEQLNKRIASGSLESQRLLIPETLELTPHHVGLLESNRALLDRIGLETTLYGESTVAVQSFPAILRTADVAGFVRDLVDRLAQQGQRPHTEILIHEVLDMMACKAAVKAGDSLTAEEIRHLLSRRLEVDKSSNCPHGRPTSLRFSWADLERQFKRT